MNNESILDVLKVDAVVVDDDGDDVETDVDIEVFVTDVGFGGPDEHALLHYAHGEVGVAVIVGFAGLYLNGDKSVVLQGDDVDFLVAGTPVAFEDLVVDEMVHGEVLAEAAEILVFIHGYVFLLATNI